MTKQSDFDVVVLGGGPAGLSVADSLSARGVRTAVVEAGPVLGGLGRSMNVWGLPVDLGPHAFMSNAHSASVTRWQDLAGGDLERTQLRRTCYWHGRTVASPPSPKDVLSTVGATGAGRMLASRLARRLVPVRDDAASYLGRLHGRAIAADPFRPYLRKYLGLEIGEIDARFASALVSSRVSGPHEKVELLTPSKGCGAVWSEAGARIAGRNGAVLLDTRVVGLRADSNGVAAVSLAGDSELTCAAVVSTLPPTLLLRWIPDVPNTAIAGLADLKTRDTALIYLLVEGDGLAEHYLTVYDPAISVGRVTDFGNWRPRAYSGHGKTVICAEYWYSPRDPLAAMDDTDLTRHAIADLSRMELPFTSRVRESHVLRLPRSIPVLTRGIQPALDSIRKSITAIPNLYAVGRHGQHQWDGQEDSLLQGEKLAATIAATLDHTASPGHARARQ